MATFFRRAELHLVSGHRVRGMMDALTNGRCTVLALVPTLAAVVPADRSVLDERRLASELECRLAKFKRPSRFVFLESFPLLANGKVDMVALKRLCHPARQNHDRLCHARPITAGG